MADKKQPPRNRAERRKAGAPDPGLRPGDRALAVALPNVGGGDPRFAMDFELHGRDGAFKLTYVVPASLGMRYELLEAIQTNPTRAKAAALGLTSAKVRANVPYRNQRADVYGLAVLDWLLEHGVPYAEVMEAGARAWLHATHGLLDGAEVSAAEGNSEGTTE